MKTQVDCANLLLNTEYPYKQDLKYQIEVIICLPSIRPLRNLPCQRLEPFSATDLTLMIFNTKFQFYPTLPC